MVSPAIFDHEKLDVYQLELISGVTQEFEGDDEHEDKVRVLAKRQHS